MDLSGTWRAAVADEALRREFADDDFDDGGWEPIEVPGHWRTASAFAESDGPLLYRTRFDHPDLAGPTQRWWLVFDGIFYQGDVWLDGAYLGDTEGYFFPHALEVTDALASRGEHVLAVEVACPPQRDRTARRNLTGVFQGGNYLDPDWNPGGLWRPVRLDGSGPVRIRTLRVVCSDATAERAVLSIRATLDTVEARTVGVETTVAGTGVDHQITQPLAAGENQVAWTITVPDPQLWWPRALGDQPLHDVHVRVLIDDQVSDRRTVRTGFRSISLRDWICSVNGERLFLKGSNLGPTKMALAEATPDELRADVRLAIDTGLDLLRIHAHITRPEIYEAADEAGLLLWQDLPLQWAYARGVRRQAVRQARAAVDLLGHHPSLALWCAHDEPSASDHHAGLDAARRPARSAIRKLVGQELPTWNRTVLDRSLRRALEKADGSRPVIAHSGVWPHPPQLDGTDSHLYFGWYHGDEHELARFAAKLPRMVRFVSEFGAQAVPVDAEFCAAERWPDLDWDLLEQKHALQKVIIDQVAPPERYASFDEWRDATQAYQARLIKFQVEALRRLKYRPTGGFAQFSFTDATPAISWSVLGHDRQAKLGHAALVEACRPVIVVADPLPPSATPGERLDLDVHVINDRRVAVADAVVSARLSWPGGERTWRWAGDVDADSCALVGAVEHTLGPEVERGAVRLKLSLTGLVEARNCYETELVPPLDRR